ncbi:hypothetical protein BVRB_6g138230 [Beta vulgaris subsp. vulgaris]|nr:hypothetical protein BVRB_6g138230 [Beta vulgaris subsp. vulgaris]
MVRRSCCRHSPAMLLPPLSRCCSSILATSELILEQVSCWIREV